VCTTNSQELPVCSPCRTTTAVDVVVVVVVAADDRFVLPLPREGDLDLERAAGDFERERDDIFEKRFKCHFNLALQMVRFVLWLVLEPSNVFVSGDAPTLLDTDTNRCASCCASNTTERWPNWPIRPFSR